MKTQRPIVADDEHRVIQFRPRKAAHTPQLRSPMAVQPQHQDAPEPLDLLRYEQPQEEPDDFRHRILANIATLAFTVALAAVGIWLAMSVVDLRKTHDCTLSGWHDCMHIPTR
ncbi:MAG: hypothetical protein ACREDC_04085 [Bradyrhizobium sp.]